MKLRWKPGISYVAVVAGCFLLAMAAGWTTLGTQLDNDVYDFFFRLQAGPKHPPESVLLAVDEAALETMGGLRRLRGILADGLEKVAGSGAKAVVIDLILADPGEEQEDARLEAALQQVENLVLACELTRDGWLEPLPRFRRWAEAIGHAHADPDPYDNVTRRLPLEKAAPGDRRWALALEAYRLSRGGGPITETPDELETGDWRIPAQRRQARPLLIRFEPHRTEDGNTFPRVSFAELSRSPEAVSRLSGKTVFVGITAQSASGDRHMTAFSAGMPMAGVEIHAHAYETLAHGAFLVPAPDWTAAFACLSIALAAGAIFALLSGWVAYAAAAVLLVTAHLAPYALFRLDWVFPFAAPVLAAWLCSAGAATHQHFSVRRQLRKSESERSRYQRAIHFVTHEMRTPLTAIQGSSELMGRYRLDEERSKQLAQMINAESKRLARMIQTWLDVERLGEGQMELRRETLSVEELVESCVERIRPLAEKKRISVQIASQLDGHLSADGELMEYAVYNLLSNAVKYSPPETVVTVEAHRQNGFLRLSVRDQGMGLDEKELRSVFKRFYRTKGAEASGEAGSGVGLSIVEQIVTHHGGRVEVTSKPGQGSCFTLVLPVPEAVPADKERG